MNNNQPLVKSCNIGDTSIDYLHYPSEGPDLLLLHATGFLPWLWHPIAGSLADTYNIVAPYFCDHRHAEPEDGGLGWDLLADDLYKFCNNLKLKTPFVAGHSMGGTVITLCAGAHTLTPAGMILIEPIFLPEISYSMKITVQQHPLASKSINRRSEWTGSDDALSYLKNRKLFSRWDDEMLELYLKYGMVTGDGGGLTLACSPRKEASLFMGGNAKNPWPMLPEIECPVLIVEGGISENKLFIDLKKVTSLFPNGTYYEVKDAGHLIPMEQPGVIADLIKKFCSGEPIHN
jgi:pimeloyl-ACP methyl ester carboxylesterase